MLLAVAAGRFGLIAQRNAEDAEDARDLAEVQRLNAVEAKTDADAARQLAEQQRQNAVEAKTEADIQRDLAEEQANLARSREVGVHAKNASDDGNLDLALLLRIEGARIAPTLEMINGLRDLLTEDKRTRLRIPGHNSAVTQALWNQPQSQVLITYADGAAGIWDAASREKLVTLAGHDKKITSAAWSPDGQQIFTAAEDGWVRVWDAASGAQLVEIHADQEHVNKRHLGSRWSPHSHRG